MFERPLRGMNVNSKALRTYRLLADICRTYSSCAACLCLQSYFWVRQILWLLKMTKKQHQRICIKFFFQLGKTSSKTIQMIQTCDWRWSSINCSWTRKWSRNTEKYCLGNFEQDFRNDSRVCSDWLLHHDNAPAHSSNLVQQFLSKHSIALLRQPPYSPDITQCDFWLFPKIKTPLKGQRLNDETAVENNATSVLKAIPKCEFQDCFEKWKHRWNHVI